MPLALADGQHPGFLLSSINICVPGQWLLFVEGVMEAELDLDGCFLGVVVGPLVAEYTICPQAGSSARLPGC